MEVCLRSESNIQLSNKADASKVRITFSNYYISSLRKYFRLLYGAKKPPPVVDSRDIPVSNLKQSQILNQKHLKSAVYSLFYGILVD